MSGIRVFVSSGFNPVLNLAMEDWLFGSLEKGVSALYLWRNKDVVVIGRYQNPWKECDLRAMDRDGIVLMRRTTGGGAVFHDSGNLNFTFLSPAAEYSKESDNAVIIAALGRFGIGAEASGRNDILAGGLKVSGSAYRETKDRCFHHGTLLISADLARLARYLTPDQRKLAAKGVESVRSRVGNLGDLSPAIGYESLRDAVIEEFFALHGERCPIEALDEGFLEREPALAEAYARLSDDNWRFGKTPDFTHELSERFPWGGMDVFLEVKEGIIVKATVFSDCLDTSVPEILGKALEGLAYGKSMAEEVAGRLEAAGLAPDPRKDIAGWLDRAAG
jgi:lipoate---protein ligase